LKKTQKKIGLVVQYSLDLGDYNLSDTGKMSLIENYNRELSSRLFYYTGSNEKITVNNDSVSVLTIPKFKTFDSIRLKSILNVLENPCRFEIWETYESQDIIHYFDTLNKFWRHSLGINDTECIQDTMNNNLIPLKCFPLYNYLIPALDNQGNTSYFRRGPCIGYALTKDIPVIDSFFNIPRVKKLLPSELMLAWSLKPLLGNQNMYELIALRDKQTDHTAPVNSTMIKYALSVVESGWNEIRLQFNKHGTGVFLDMTEKNIGCSLAIMLDGKIVSYPTVQTKIEKGAASITGNYTKKETEEIADKINFSWSRIRMKVMRTEFF
jgi:hypothetical protein